MSEERDKHLHYRFFLYILLMKRYKISFSGVCFKNETNMAKYFDPMFMFNKSGEVLGSSDFSFRFTLSKLSEFTHFKMVHPC